MTDTAIARIDADLRRIQAALEGARAAHRHSPNADNADRVRNLEALRDRALDHRIARKVADATVNA